MQIETALRFHLTPVRWLGSKSQVTVGTGKDVDKEHSFTTGGIATWYNHSGHQVSISQRTLSRGQNGNQEIEKRSLPTLHLAGG